MRQKFTFGVEWIWHHVLQPTSAMPTRSNQAIVGVIRDEDTRAPSQISSPERQGGRRAFIGVDIVETRTDARAATGWRACPRAPAIRILFVPDGSDQQRRSAGDVPDTLGLDPVTVDVELKRGVWLEGKVTDKVTGRPIAEANVEYLTFYSNPNHSDFRQFAALVCAAPSRAGRRHLPRCRHTRPRSRDRIGKDVPEVTDGWRGWAARERSCTGRLPLPSTIRATTAKSPRS